MFGSANIDTLLVQRMDAFSTRRYLIALLVGTVLVSPFPGLVSGNHGGRPIGALFSCDRPVTPPRCTSVADNRRHLVVFDDTLTEELASSLRDSMAEDYGSTELVLIEQPALTRMTDVIAFSQDYGDNGAAGWVYCPPAAPQGTNPTGDRWCRHQELHLNLNARYSAFFADDPSRDHVTCHELGHTVGLRHWGNPPQTSGSDVGATCMNANTPDGPAVLHQVDIDHINTYAYRQGPPRRHHILQPPVSPQLQRLLRPWSGTLQATEIEQFASLDELAREADAVVRGEVISVAPGRAFGESASALHYASATLRVDELVAGALPDEYRHDLTLEIPLFDGADGIDRLPDWGESLFFLRNKGESARVAGLAAERQAEERGFYRLVSFASLVVNQDGLAVTDPEAPLLADLDGRPFADVVVLVRSSAN